MNTIDSDIVIAKVADAKSIIITAHLGPDGDSIGSSIGLASFLSAIGKNVKIIMHDKVPEYLSYLDEHSKVISISGDKDARNRATKYAEICDLFLILDLNTLARVGQVAELIESSQAHKIVIDHHQNPKEFAHGYYIDTEASSTCLLVFRIVTQYIDQLGISIPVTKKNDIATALYTGIYTDSGGFSFPRTTSELLQAAATLIAWGANPVEISRKINSSKKISAYRLQGLATRRMKLSSQADYVITALDYNDFESVSANPEDKEGLVNKPLELESVQVSALITRTSEHEPYKISFRSQGPHVNQLATKLGGGGHIYAAAARIVDDSKTMNDIINLLDREIQLLVDDYASR